MIEDFDPVERTVSGKGVIKIPEDWGSAFSVFLYCQVIRESISASKNLTYNPDKGFYAHITFCIDDYVLYTLDMNFKQQVFELHKGISSQILLSLICAYDGILDSFVELGNAVSAVISRTNLIKGHPYERFVPNIIRFECFSSTAIQLSLRGKKIRKCTLEDGESAPPPPKPDPVIPVEPGEPIEVSPPEPGDDDALDTDPFPSDTFPPQILEGHILFIVRDQTGVQTSWAVPATSQDSLAFQNGTHAGCLNGGQDLYLNADLYYSRWSCQAEVLIDDQQFSPGDDIPPPYVFIDRNV